MHNEPSLARNAFIDLNSNNLNYFPFKTSLDRCNGSINTLDDPAVRICVSSKTGNVNVKSFNMTTGINVSKSSVKQFSCDCKWRFDSKNVI